MKGMIPYIPIRSDFERHDTIHRNRIVIYGTHGCGKTSYAKILLEGYSYIIIDIYSMDNKIQLYNNINKANNSEIIITYILNNDIPYTKNTNGYFINLSLLNDNDINLFNHFINNNININDDYIENTIKSDTIIKYKEIIDTEMKDKEFKKIKLTNFEKKILSFSLH